MAELATYPPKITLPYRVGKSWLEDQILAGRLVDPRHELDIELDRLEPDLRERVVAVWKHVKPRGIFLEVIGSGIRPADSIVWGDPDEWPYAVDPLHERIGSLPELREPAKDPAVLIEGYERWIERYRDVATGALATWIDQHATDELTDDLRGAGVDSDWWLREIEWRVKDHPVRRCVLDGRKDLPLFQRARGAWQAVEVAKEEGDADDWVMAENVIGTVVELERKPDDWGDLVSAYEDHCERLAELTRAHAWTRQRQREGFELEMTRWAFERGSDRLKMGIADGYRMIPVYLRERIEAEVPGFYAYLPKKRDDVSWQDRTAPSQAALRYRRAVQDRLDQHVPPGSPAPRAEIVWMKNSPGEMCDDTADRWFEDFEGDTVKRRVPFECIVVPEWLGRYTLMAGVVGEEHTVPHYLLLKHVLRPEDYGLDDLPSPPLGKTIHAVNAAAAAARADDDIPF